MTGTVPAVGPQTWQLRRAAEIVLARPLMAGIAATTTAAEYAERNGPALRRLWAASEPLRRAVLEADDADGDAESGRRAARERPSADEKSRRRQEHRLAELQERVKLHRGRAEIARHDAEALRERFRLVEERVREAEERAAATALERDALSRRAMDPLRALRTLHRALRDDGAAPGGRDEPVSALRDLLERSGVNGAGLRATLEAVLVPPLPEGAAGPAGGPPDAAAASRTLRVVPLGGGTEIGGSCVLVELGGTRVLVDAGIRPDDRSDHLPPPLLHAALAEGPPVRALVVTHAHNDHCGWVPVLTASRPDLRVLCSPPTAELLPLVWRDTANLLARRVRERRGWGDTAADAPYGHAEVHDASRAVEDLPYGTRTTIGDLVIELFPAGHVLGSAGVVVTGGGRRVVISGDISLEGQLGAEPFALPPAARDPDLLLLESTCCDATHRPRGDLVADMVRAVRETCEHDGRVLFPAMGLGRAQEIALTLSTHLPEVPVLIDGLAGAVAEAYGRHTGGSRPAGAVLGDRVTRVVDRQAERLTFRRGVVISTSGTLRGGPVVEWARDILPDPANALFVSGYQDEEAPGRRLLELTRGAATLDLPGGPVQVRADVREFQLGAHADRDALLSVVDQVRPRQVMLVHGRREPQRRFREILTARGDHPVDTAEWSTSCLSGGSR